MTACPQGSGAGHLCRLLGGLQGPWSCGTLCSKAMGITNPGAPRQAHGAPLSAGLSSGLCHLSLGTFSPSLPHPLPYFLLGTGGQTSGVVQGAAGRAGLTLPGSGEPREAPGVTKSTANQSNETFGVTDSQGTVPARGARPRDGKAAAALPSFLVRAGRDPSCREPGSAQPRGSVPSPAQGCSTWRCLCRAASPAAGAGLWRVRNLIRGELPAPAEPRASPAPLQTQRRARNAAPHPAPTARSGGPSCKSALRLHPPARRGLGSERGCSCSGHVLSAGPAEHAELSLSPEHGEVRLSHSSPRAVSSSSSSSSSPPSSLAHRPTSGG